MTDTNITRQATRRPVPDTLFGGRMKDCVLLDLEVIEVSDLSPRFRSITFSSTDLIDFAWRPGQDIMFDVPGDDRAVRRRYTIRRADPVAGTLDIEVVLHGSGPFARWATSVAPGDRIEGIGPRGAIGIRDDAANHLFVGDESAIAVTFALLEALPADAPSTTLLLADGEPPQLPSHPGLSWFTSAESLIGALRDTALADRTAAYLNGERSLVRDAARLLAEHGLDPDRTATKAYWRSDQANASHGEPGRD